MVRTLINCFLSLGIFAVAADAGMIISLQAKDANGAALASEVAVGTQASVDILLSVDGDDNPLPDLRGLQFDLSGSSTSITIDSFTWSVNGVAYSFQTTNPPTVSAITLLSTSSSILLTLTGTPVRVAIVEVTINESGVLDVRNPDAPDTNTGASLSAGFASRKDFSLIDGNLSGGTISFTVPGMVDPGNGGGGGDSGGNGGGGGTTTDSDNDGVVDSVDAFPADPTETTDTDSDSVGDNIDAFPTDPTETTDTNGDGVGNNADPDDDSDGVPDVTDAFPLDPAETTDTDSDGVGDNTDNSDGDTQTPPQPTPIRLCGVGMLAPSLLIFAALCGVRPSRRNRNVLG